MCESHDTLSLVLFLVSSVDTLALRAEIQAPDEVSVPCASVPCAGLSSLWLLRPSPVSYNSLSWVASTMFVLVVFAFVVLTVVAGSFELISEEDYLFRYRSRHCLVHCFGFECPHRQATQPPRQDTQPP